MKILIRLCFGSINHGFIEKDEDYKDNILVPVVGVGSTSAWPEMTFVWPGMNLWINDCG